MALRKRQSRDRSLGDENTKLKPRIPSNR